MFGAVPTSSEALTRLQLVEDSCCCVPETQGGWSGRTVSSEGLVGPPRRPRGGGRRASEASLFSSGMVAERTPLRTLPKNDPQSRSEKSYNSVGAVRLGGELPKADRL